MKVIVDKIGMFRYNYFRELDENQFHLAEEAWQEKEAPIIYKKR